MKNFDTLFVAQLGRLGFKNIATLQELGVFFEADFDPLGELFPDHPTLDLEVFL